jgi:hypothetical protein
MIVVLSRNSHGPVPAIRAGQRTTLNTGPELELPPNPTAGLANAVAASLFALAESGTDAAW